MPAFDHPILLAIGCALSVVATVGVVRWSVRWTARVPLLLALLALTLSIGGLTLRRPTGKIAVLVDLSPSTRGATYRDPGALKSRVDQLLGNRPFDLIRFGENATDGTTLPPVDADVALLFSDGRFSAPPPGPAIFPVIDPGLIDPPDAAVRTLTLIDGEASAAVLNPGGRRLTINNATVNPAAGAALVRREVGGAAAAVARFAPGDRWPENDALAVSPAPPPEGERWWVGDSPPAGWRAFRPADLPADAAAWLAPSVVVLNDVTAGDLDGARLRRIEQFARDLGGSLVLLGGSKSFGAGDWGGTVLETLSPLSSVPPTPATRWVLLADASGSMAAAKDGWSRWDEAVAALSAAVAGVPGRDPVSVGRFAGDVRWAYRDVPAADAASRPPLGGKPGGATNLQAALETVAADAERAGGLPTRLLLLTDAEADLTDAGALAARLAAANVTVDLIATDQVPDARVRSILTRTGGRLLTEQHPGAWSAAAKELVADARPTPLRPGGSVRFVGPIAAVPARSVGRLNATWPKQGITPLAVARGETVAAEWAVGTGTVAAAAFAPTAAEAAALADQVAAAPADPRFSVSIDEGPEGLTATLDSTGGGTFANGLTPTLSLADADAPGGGEKVVMPQVGPGEYRLAVPGPRRASILTVSVNGRPLARRAVAGRYPAEFEAVGVDAAALARLAAVSGGRVVGPTDVRPLDLPLPTRAVPLGPWLAAIGAGLLAVSLVLWRGGRRVGRPGFFAKPQAAGIP